jgi:protein arginine kinase activator
MKCEHCNQNEATFFYEETINGQKRQMHLCAECAAKMQGELPKFPSFSNFGEGLFGSLFGLSAAPKSGKICEGCGASWQKLHSAGKAFCPQCYLTFREELEPTLRQLHGNVTHVGRAPADEVAKSEKEQKLSALKKALEEAIKSESFEQAAKLRDEIRAINEKGEA